LAGVLVLVSVLVAGKYIDAVPIASLAGLLLVVAYDLIDYRAIKATVLANVGDRVAFIGTLIATWMMPLDKAIYFGVAVSIFMFLRQARLLVVQPLMVDDKGRLREVSGDGSARFEVTELGECSSVKVVNVEGALFFGAAGELYNNLSMAISNRETQALVLRIKRGQGVDVTTAAVLVSIAKQMRASGRRLLLVGMRPNAMAVLERVGAVEEIGAENLFPTRPGWFEAMDIAVKSAIEGVEHSHDDQCPLERYLQIRGGDESEI
jgi:SulP family sulfate permease